jgi:hypothetical protein
MEMTDEDLAGWRAQPATEFVKAAMGKSLALQREACMEAAWAGSPWPEAERLALHRALTLFGDLFEASAADFAAMMEIMK